MRKKALLSLFSNIILQVVLILSNMIIPHYIILIYGSNVNGLINSLTQFLGYVALFEAGVGGVIKSTLYKALAKKDDIYLSKIMNSSRKYFKLLGIILIIYVVILCVFYPLLFNNEFSRLYTLILLLIIAINNFIQYYFGIANQLLIQADQKSYIINFSKIISFSLSTISMIICAILNVKIHILKAIGTIFLILPPIIYHFYIEKNYNINSKVNDDGVLKQKWDGFSHQLSYFIHSNTDILILTIFTNFSVVSVYSVYSLITNGLKSLLGVLTNTISAPLGTLYANKKIDKLKKQFLIFDYFNLLIVIFIFSIAAIMITPFVKIYVSGVTDINYDRLLFGFILVAAEAVYTLRISYTNIIFAAGHFKETRFHSYIESGANIIISLVLVFKLGLIGIAIGTLTGMLLRLILSILYVNNHICSINLKSTMIKYIINLSLSFVFIYIIVNYFIFEITSYLQWVIFALIISIIFFVIMFICNFIIFKKDFYDIIKEYFLNILKIRKKVTK